MRPLHHIAFAGLLLAVSAAASAADSSLPNVKAAFAYNFVKLAAWPAQRFTGASAPLQVCVIKSDPMESALRESLAGKLAGERIISVQSVGSDDSFASCHALYLGASLAPRFPALMGRAVAKGVLLIDEGPQFTWPDGMIRLYTEQNRVRFELNLEALERAGLKVDPRLIRLARIATR